MSAQPKRKGRRPNMNLDPTKAKASAPAIVDLDAFVDGGPGSRGAGKPVSQGAGVPVSAGTAVERKRRGTVKRLTCYASPELAARLREHCHREDRQISDVMAEALTAYLDELQGRD